MSWASPERSFPPKRPAPTPPATAPAPPTSSATSRVCRLSQEALLLRIHSQLIISRTQPRENLCHLSIFACCGWLLRSKLSCVCVDFVTTATAFPLLSQTHTHASAPSPLLHAHQNPLCCLWRSIHHWQLSLWKFSLPSALAHARA